MLRLRWLMALLIVGALAWPRTTLAQKITVDPNAPGTRVENSEAQFDDSEERLARKVTMQMTRQSVKQILSVLAKQTGVTLKAGINQQDWQVRDRRMNIYCKDLPLSNLMNSIGRVMKFKWAKEKSKDGTYAYRLYMDRKTLLDEEAQRARDEERRAKLETERRQKALESYARIANTPEAELAKLRKEDPFNYVMATSGAAKGISGLFAECPALVQALATGQQADIQASSLSGKGQGFLIEAWSALNKMIASVEPHMPKMPDDAASDMGSIILRINPNQDMMRNAPGSFVLGEIDLHRNGKQEMDFPLIDPESNVGKFFGEIILECMETGKNPEDMEREFRDRFSAAIVADSKRDSEPDQDPKVERLDDPALHAKIKLKSDSRKLDDIQNALSDAAGIAVVSDSFRKKIPFQPAIDTETELGDLLDKIGEGFQYDWAKPSSAIEFRDKKWFAKRAAQIPDAWLEDWRATLKEKGTLELDDVAAISSLTHEQLEENIYEDEVLMASGVLSSYYGGREVLKFYNTLNEAQRLAAFTTPGLDMASLTAEQWTKAARAISHQKPGLTPEQSSPMKFTIVRDQAGDSLDWDLTITSGDTMLLQSHVHAPRYQWVENLNKQQKDKTEEKKPEPKQ